MGQPTIFASAQGSCHMDARWCTWKIKHIKGYNQRKKEVHEDIRGFRVSCISKTTSFLFGYSTNRV